MTKQSVTGQGVTVTLHQHPDDIDEIAKADQELAVSDQDFTKLMAQAKPGDADHEPQCETTKAFVEPLGTPILDEPLTDNTTAKDIKRFIDLPEETQQAIMREGPDIVDDYKKRCELADNAIKQINKRGVDGQA